MRVLERKIESRLPLIRAPECKVKPLWAQHSVCAAVTDAMEPQPSGTTILAHVTRQGPVRLTLTAAGRRWLLLRYRQRTACLRQERCRAHCAPVAAAGAVGIAGGHAPAAVPPPHNTLVV